MAEKIKVVYLCHFANDRISAKLPLTLDCLTRLAYWYKNKPVTTNVVEHDLWNTYAFKEFEKFTDEIELHVISPYLLLSPKTFHLVENGINYHFFRDDDNRPDRFLFNRLTKYKYLTFSRNREKILAFVKQIKPDIVHLVGAENPHYASAILDIPQEIPVLTQLQTLLSDPEFEKNYYMYKPWYNYRSDMEMKIFRRSDFLGTRAQQYINNIHNNLLPDKTILNTTLALTEPINASHTAKEYDFVYFARNIAKAGDWVIEAFVLASLKHPGITLDIVGEFKVPFREQLEKRLAEFGLNQFVKFEGLQPTHDDVLRQVRKSRFAILPMKIDLLTGTIKECMANGIPVVTTITPSTPKVNLQRECLLVSEKEDFQGMADNMCRLLESEELAEMIRANAYTYISERSSNFDVVKQYVSAYHCILDYKRKGEAIPQNLIS